MRFKELNENLFKVLGMMIDNQNLCKLIQYDIDNPLSKPDVTNPQSLLFTKILPHPFNVDILMSASSIISVTFDNFELDRGGMTYKNGIVNFTILCHNSLWKVDGGFRPFFIAEEIENLFNDQRVIGIGTMRFDKFRQVWASKDYSGYQLSYKITDFN